MRTERSEAPSTLKCQTAEPVREGGGFFATDDRILEVLETIPNGFLFLNHKWCCRYVNQTGCRLLRREAKELLGSNFREFFAEAVGQGCYSELERALRDNIQVHFEEFFAEPLNLWFECHAYPSPEGLWVFFSDITFRKQTDEALRASEHEFRAMFELAGVGKAQADPETGRFTRVNRRFCEITGYSAEELLAKTFHDITHPEDRPMDRAQIEKVRRGLREDWSIEKRYVRKDGEIIWGQVHGTALRDRQGRLIRTMAVIQDVTARKASEGALQEAYNRLRDLTSTLEQQVAERTAIAERRSMQLRRLALELSQTEERERHRLATVLHDHLQQLLVSAKFGIDGLQRHISGTQEAVALDKVDRLIDECINASKSLSVELSPPILHEAGLTAALEWLGRWMRQKYGLAVSVKSELDLQEDSEGICVMLFQAVRELLFNVAKHAATGAAWIRMSRTAGHQVRIAVADRGAGFDPASLTMGDTNAVGLGLFSIRERLELLGGNFEIESAPGRGTTVTLTAPLPEVFPVEAAVAPACPGLAVPACHASAPPYGGDHIRVLLTDDHKIMRQGLAGLLNGEADIQIVGEAANGRLAVEMAHKLRPDVIIMDISMPVMNGIEATRIITAELPKVSVIGLSMFDEADRASAMINAGAVAYLNKAGPSEDLIAAVRRCGTAGQEKASSGSA